VVFVLKSPRLELIAIEVRQKRGSDKKDQGLAKHLYFFNRRRVE